ncbi:MAG: 4Fe-4S binding protein [Candidatus Thermoplasmatota archaeon]|jgi:formate hydrogenlyase subunit 6/NADH:ubiquinone oxidoreductase subunit I|nr:4Fe-4S binding protein [Candidatus Thermoplasmatota archaeon]MCL5680866.1 4Fe-4S binding protein [Candidatus Thermoplasmatota archaeon]MDA8055426.1 4Fe-4S binding protein [Thermoplasmatales archaeon]
MIKENKPNLSQDEIWREPVNLALFRKPQGKVHVIAERCKECNYCTNYCPNEVLERSTNTNSHGYHYVQVKAGKESSCVNCGMCQTICPDFAIFVTEVQ